MKIFDLINHGARMIESMVLGENKVCIISSLVIH